MIQNRPVFALFLLLSACGAAGASTAAPSAPLTPQRLYPLSNGRIWSYDVDTGTGVNTLAIARVTERGQGRFEVATGSEPNVYEVAAEGIRRANGTWLLRAPIEAHASWQLADGRRAEIVSIDASAQTPAGDFTHCVEVAERGGAGAQIRTIYCPDIGPVFIESSMDMLVARETLRVTAKLRGYADGSEQ